MKRTTLFASVIAAAAITTSFCRPAGATSIYYAFTGVVDGNHSEYANLTTFTGLFSFDPLRPDAAPADPDDGYYPMNNGGFGLSVDFAGGPSFLTDAMANYSLAVHVPQATIVGQPPDYGRFTAHGHVFNQTDRFLDLSFRKNFQTDALPGGVFGLADFDLAQFFYNGLPQVAPGPGQQPPPPYGIVGHLTSLTCVDGCVDVVQPIPNAVPEPGTMALLFAGLTMPGLLLRARRKADAQPQPSRVA